MRIRIVEPAKGKVDEFDLTTLKKGRVYDLNSALAAYLIASGYAVPATREEPTEDRRKRPR